MQLTEKQKYEIIVLREENYKINEIANKMKINRITVMKWINRYEKYKNIERKEGSGKNIIVFDDYIFSRLKINELCSFIFSGRKKIKSSISDKSLLILLKKIPIYQ